MESNVNMTSKGQLRAGAAFVHSTPGSGTHLSGSGYEEHRPAQAVIDPLFAKAIVFESGDRRASPLILSGIYQRETLMAAADTRLTKTLRIGQSWPLEASRPL